jgi:hypothetical protein
MHAHADLESTRYVISVNFEVAFVTPSSVLQPVLNPSVDMHPHKSMTLSR